MNTPGMNGREIEFIPDRLIEEPVVFRGLTDSEVVMITIAAVIFWIPATVLLLLPFDLALFGVAIGFGMAILTLLLIGKYLQGLKRRMPDGLHIVYLKKMAQKKGIPLCRFGYIDESGSWDIRRSRSVEKIEFESED